MAKLDILVGGKRYKIDEHGNVDKRRGAGYLKSFPDKNGYLKLAFTTSEKLTINKFVHRLMYETFIGPIPPGLTVDHKDGDKRNNHYNNLQLMLAVDNVVKGNAKCWTLLSPLGEIVKVYNLKQFCRDNDLHRSHLYSVLNSKPKYHAHKGWRKYNG